MEGRENLLTTSPSHCLSFQGSVLGPVAILVYVTNFAKAAQSACWQMILWSPSPELLQSAIDNREQRSGRQNLPSTEGKFVNMALVRVDHRRFAVNGVDALPTIDLYKALASRKVVTFISPTTISLSAR